MLDINSVNLNKIRDSIQAKRQGASNPQNMDFNTLLLEIKMKQVDAWSGLLGDETSTRSDSLAGYQDLLLNSLKSFGVKNNFQPEASIKNYKAVEDLKVSPQTGSSTSIRDLVTESARKYDIPESWFEKLIQQESSFDSSALSPKGAIGLGQLMPATAKDLGLRVGSSQDHSEGSVWNPSSNLNASARYLRQLYDRYAGMGIEKDEAWKFAAGAYNAGMGNIQKAIDIVDSVAPLEWEQVASVLPKVTGTASKETIHYVGKL